MIACLHLHLTPSRTLNSQADTRRDRTHTSTRQLKPAMPAAPRGSGAGASFPCPDCDKKFSRKEVRRPVLRPPGTRRSAGLELHGAGQSQGSTSSRSSGPLEFAVSGRLNWTPFVDANC